MQNYISQLIGDIKEAKKRVPPEPEPAKNYEEFETQMHKMENADGIPMSELFGLEQMYFPSVDKLSKEHLNTLTIELIELWLSFRIYPNFPEGLPIERQYKLMVNELNTDIHYTPGWESSYEFCQLDTKNCVYENDFCWCKEHEAEWEADYLKFEKELKKNPDDLPF